MRSPQIVPPSPPWLTRADRRGQANMSQAKNLRGRYNLDGGSTDEDAPLVPPVRRASSRANGGKGALGQFFGK